MPDSSWLESLYIWSGDLLSGVDRLIFFKVAGFPLIVLWLILGGFFFTCWFSFINFRAFVHSIEVVLGRYDNPEEVGEVSHFQALATALSATVGLGNIAGVAIAIEIGGPGATFWMTISGLFAMTTKFVECTLGHKYRLVKADGSIAGGPMYYLSRGLASQNQESLGKFLACLFCILAISGALGSTIIYQSNQSKEGVAQVLPFIALHPWVYGLAMMVLVGVVIVGGIKRIASVADKIVPLMCGIYILAALWVIGVHLSEVPQAFVTIVKSAISPEAILGGGAGVALVQGFRRSAFSNEAGLGIAAIAHSAAKTEESIREGIVALLEPFIDTVIICNMTGLVVILTGAWNNPDLLKLGGASLTSAAFASVIPWFPYVLAFVVFLFAFSTMISWGYYGQLCWNYLFGDSFGIVYKILLLLSIFFGSVASADAVIHFSDALFLTMSIPNLLGLYLLANQVKEDLHNYLSRLNSGAMKPVKAKS